MNLISTNYLTLTLSSAQSADVIASWKDSDGGDMDGKNTKITLSTTETTIVGAPNAQSRRRRVTDLHIRMPAANTENVTATLKQSDGTTTWEVFSAVLAPLDVLIYDHQRGFTAVSNVLIGDRYRQLLVQQNPQLLV